MKKMAITMPADLVRALKVYAAEHETTIKGLVIEAVRKQYGFKEGGEESKRD